MRLVGIDCATDDQKVGLCLAQWKSGSLQILDVRLASRESSAAATATLWLREAPEHCGLVMLDAPLGWPAEMGNALASHRAGELSSVEPHSFFRRETDRAIQARLGKTPLDVGADRIARTAHAALRVLHQVRRDLHSSVPLVWDRGFGGLGAIEVYPAATLRARGLSDREYKKPVQTEARNVLIDALSREVTFVGSFDVLRTSADALDALVCVLAGKDFLEGLSVPPDDLELAKREGWIWTAHLGASAMLRLA